MESIVVFGIIDDIPKEKGKILLLHEKGKPAPALFKMPGGTVEEGEALGRALAREIKEETGIEAIACGDEFYKKNLKTHKFVAFRVQYVSGEISLGEEIEKIELFSPEEAMMMLRHKKIVPTHAEPLKRFLELYYGLEVD